ncbi:unnamed protein product [Pleuronectes platessa]|uniref:Uncharacterized protein n=1 Tax=Pleuronectes platessa TaxID=8262 RepID=A0A9N7UXE6_PLEPL|nr:unnamed protein product [Pleuronectes platessa]
MCQGLALIAAGYTFALTGMMGMTRPTLSLIGPNNSQCKESDEDDTQREEQRAGPLPVPQQESEDTTQRDELREEPLTVPQESDEDDSQREEERAEPLTVPQENNEGGSQRQEQRAEPFTMVQLRQT